MVTLKKTTLELTQFVQIKGSSASKMSAAKVVDVIAGLPDCVRRKQLTHYLLRLK